MKRADPTSEQLQLIKQHLLIPVAIQVLDLDIEQLQLEKMKFGEVYAGIVKEWRERLFQRHYAVRAGLKEHGIKVHLAEQNKAVGLRAEYWIRGYKDEFGMIPNYVRAQVEVLIQEAMKKQA